MHPLDIFDKFSSHFHPSTEFREVDHGICESCSRTTNLIKWGQDNYVHCYSCYALRAKYKKTRLSDKAKTAICVTENKCTAWISTEMDIDKSIDVHPWKELNWHVIMECDYSSPVLWIFSRASPNKLIDSLNLTLSDRNVFLCGGYYDIHRIDIKSIRKYTKLPLTKNEWEILFIRLIDYAHLNAGIALTEISTRIKIKRNAKETTRELQEYDRKYPGLLKSLPPYGSDDHKILLKMVGNGQ